MNIDTQLRQLQRTIPIFPGDVIIDAYFRKMRIAFCCLFQLLKLFLPLIESFKFLQTQHEMKPIIESVAIQVNRPLQQWQGSSGVLKTRLYDGLEHQEIGIIALQLGQTVQFAFDYLELIQIEESRQP